MRRKPRSFMDVAAAAVHFVAAAVARALARIGEPPPEGVSRDDAAARVHGRVMALANHLQATRIDATLGSVPCGDPAGKLSKTGVYFMSGTQRLSLGAERVPEALRAADRYFQDSGFRVKPIRWFDHGSGDLRATSPEGFIYSLLPTRAGPTQLAFFVDSPCCQAPDGEDPADGMWRPPPGLLSVVR